MRKQIVKSLHKLRTNQYHPDKNKHNPKAQEQFVKVNEAYSILIKPETRREYDATLSSAYTSPMRSERTQGGGYYRVHRHDSQYRDPWTDPSFARNRTFTQEDRERMEKDYYGVGIDKKTNEQLRFWIVVIAGVGLLFQVILIRASAMKSRHQYDVNSEKARQHLKIVKEKADSFENRDQQIAELERSLNMNSKN